MDYAALLSGIGAVMSGIAAIIAALALRQTQSTHRLVNGQTHALLELTDKSAHAEGVLEGRNEDPR